MPEESTLSLPFVSSHLVSSHLISLISFLSSGSIPRQKSMVELCSLKGHIGYSWGMFMHALKHNQPNACRGLKCSIMSSIMYHICIAEISSLSRSIHLISPKTLKLDLWSLGLNSTSQLSFSKVIKMFSLLTSLVS